MLAIESIERLLIEIFDIQIENKNILTEKLSKSWETFKTPKIWYHHLNKKQYPSNWKFQKCIEKRNNSISADINFWVHLQKFHSKTRFKKISNSHFANP